MSLWSRISMPCTASVEPRSKKSCSRTLKKLLQRDATRRSTAHSVRAACPRGKPTFALPNGLSRFADVRFAGGSLPKQGYIRSGCAFARSASAPVSPPSVLSMLCSGARCPSPIPASFMSSPTS